ncbi:MAG: carbohydrate porin [Methylocella sp.]
MSIPAVGEFKRGLLDLGLNFKLNYTGEVLGNPLGGVRQRAIYESLLELAIDGDLQTIAGLNGASFHINSYHVNGPGLSTCCILNFLTVSNIEALPSSRLFEAWFEQKLFGDMASLRVGQLAANLEFAVGEFTLMYLNASFGWPNIFAANMPNGGPNYPVATPGIA